MLFNKNKDFRNAYQCFDRAIALKANFAEAYLGRAVLKYKISSPVGMWDDFLMAIKLRPNFGEAYYERGLIKTFISGRTPNNDGDTLAIHWFSATGQEKMIVQEEDFTAYTYQSASKTVLSLNKLPQNIQNETKKLFDESFWDLKDSIHFVNAQIVDIISYLKDGDPHKRHSVVPKYELNFYLKDASI